MAVSKSVHHVMHELRSNTRHTWALKTSKIASPTIDGEIGGATRTLRAPHRIAFWGGEERPTRYALERQQAAKQAGEQLDEDADQRLL